uniref:Uncharacterized protein n=1 Tax=Oryza nivara TaxID=4536 RepID=A0A0E0HL75_ORYNI
MESAGLGGRGTGHVVRRRRRRRSGWRDGEIGIRRATKTVAQGCAVTARRETETPRQSSSVLPPALGLG